MIQYGILNDENTSLIKDKCKIRLDGVYTFRGIVFRTKDGRVTHYACRYKILENFGNFVAEVGTYASEKDAIKLLKGLK